MRKQYFGNSQFYKSVLFIAIPVMGQMLVTTVVSLIDNFMVAQLGDIKMSGVNISTQIFFIVQVATSSLAVAGGIFLTQFVGAKKKYGMQQAFRFKMIMLLLVALLSMIIIFFFKEPLLNAMVHGNSNASEIVPYGVQYINIIILSFIPFCVTTALSSSLRETGTPHLPLVLTLIAAIINTIGNYALIYGNFGAPRLEVAGAAYSTLFARIVEMILFIIAAHKKDFYVPLFKLFTVDFKIFKQIIKRSFWLLSSDLAWAFSETIINAVYNGLGGSEVVSGMSAGWTICDMFFLVHAGFGTAITVILGGTLGKNNMDEARQQAVWFRVLSLIIGAVVGLIEAGCSLIMVPTIFGQLSAQAQYVALSLVFAVALYMPVWTLTNAQYYILLSGGDSFSMLIIENSINLLVCLPLVFILARFTNVGPVMLYALIKIATVLKPVLSHFAIKKEKWVQNLT